MVYRNTHVEAMTREREISMQAHTPYRKGRPVGKQMIIERSTGQERLCSKPVNEVELAVISGGVALIMNCRGGHKLPFV